MKLTHQFALISLFAALLLIPVAFAQNNLHDFPPAATGGLQTTVITVGTGVAMIGNTPTIIAETVLTLPKNTTSYVYVDLVGGTITSNTSGFTSSEYPVAVVVTDGIHVTSLTDVRPGTYQQGGSGTFSAGGDLSGTGSSQNVIGMLFGSTNFTLSTSTPPTSGNLCLGYLNSTTLGGIVCGGIGYPGAGVPNSTGSAWGSSYTVGTAANNLVQLNGSAALPAVSAANLTNFPTFNQNTTGTAGGLSGNPAISVSSLVDTAISASTSPVCPNGAGGAFTTSGCSSGSGSLSGMTAGQVPIAATGSTVTSSLALVGGGTNPVAATITSLSPNQILSANGSGILVNTTPGVATDISNTSIIPASDNVACLFPNTLTTLSGANILSSGFVFCGVNLNSSTITYTPASGVIYPGGGSTQLIPSNWAFRAYTNGVNTYMPVEPTIKAFADTSAGGLAETFNASTGTFGTIAIAGGGFTPSSSPGVGGVWNTGAPLTAGFTQGPGTPALTINTMYGSQMTIPYPVILGHMDYDIQTAGSSDLVGYSCVYNLAGTSLLWSATTSPAAATGGFSGSAAQYTLEPGTYLVTYGFTGTTGPQLLSYGETNGISNISNQNGTRYFTAANGVSSGCPSTTGALTKQVAGSSFSPLSAFGLEP